MSTADLILSILSMVAGSIVIGVTSAFVWFRASKAQIYDRMEKIEQGIMANAGKYNDWHLDGSKKLHGLEIHHESTAKALQEIRDLAHKTSRSVERLLQAIVSNGDHRG